MNEQKLKEWLQASDATASEPMMLQLDASRLGRLVVRRRVLHRGFAAAGVAAVAMAISLLAISTDRTQERVAVAPRAEKITAAVDQAGAADLKTSQVQLAAVEREIVDRQALVAALRQAGEMERFSRELSELKAENPDSSSRSSIQAALARSEAAAVSLSYADTLAGEFGEKELAAAEYRAIVTRYPGTSWSAAAARSLQPPARSL